MKPISIILPVYNGGKYLPLAVESVLEQTFTDFEFFIIDDCSTDASWEYLLSLKDSRVKLFKNQSNKGLFYNLNFLIKQSEAPLVKLWSQDDIMYPDCIQEIITFYEQNPKVGFIYTGRDYIDEEGTLIEHNIDDDTPAIVFTELHARIAFFIGSIAGNIANVTLSRDALNKVGLFNEGMKISGDFDMWVRIAKDYPIGFIRDSLVKLRNHKGQLSRQEQYYIFHLEEDIKVYNYLLSYTSKEQRREGRSMLRNRKLLFYQTLMLKALFKGHIKTAYKFFVALNKFDNVFILSCYFIRNRIFKMKTPELYSDYERIQFRLLDKKKPLPAIHKTEENSPFISVLMTSYNREKYIAEAIESILESSYTNFELLIVDDASSDNTVAIARSYEAKDQRMKVYVNEHNMGQFENRNLAVSHATGKYIKFVDSDDFIFSDTLQVMVDGMEQYPEAAMGICQISNKEDKYFPELITPEITYKQHFFGEGVLRYGPTGVIINREIFNKLGGFSYNKYVGDTEFWLKLSAVYPILKLRPGLVFWRVHSEQEFNYGNISHSYVLDAYKAYIHALMSEDCPLEVQDIKRITRRLQWKHARDILSVAFKKRHLKEAFRIYKNSDINFFTLLSGLLSYGVMKSRF